MRFFSDSRGQEEAPFELLISVIIMGFVIFLGLNAMNYVQDEQCKSQISFHANRLKIAIEKVVTSGNANSFSFELPQCFTKPKDRPEMRFVTLQDSLQCSRLCGGALNECFVFVYNSDEFNYMLCFKEVAPMTSFYTSAPCNAPEHFVAVDMKDDIYGFSRGQYEFFNKSSLVESFPRICAYLRKAG